MNSHRPHKYARIATTLLILSELIFFSFLAIHLLSVSSATTEKAASQSIAAQSNNANDSTSQDFIHWVDFDVTADKIWNSLNEDNKVSLFVRYIDIKSGGYESRIYNKNK